MKTVIIRKRRKNPGFTRFFVCVGHAFLMILLCWWWQTVDFTTGIESSLVSKSLLLKRKLFDPKPDTSCKFLFLDVSGTKKLIPRNQRSGSEQITDRGKLADFLSILSRFSEDQYQYVICDILFDRVTDDDTLLKRSFDNLDKIVIPYTINEEGVVYPVFSEVNAAYMGYNESSGFSSSNMLVKYTLISNPSLKSLPVVTYQHTDRKYISRNAGLTWIDEKALLNEIIIDYRIRPGDTNDEKTGNRIIGLDDMLDLLNSNDSLFFSKFIEGKIIVIGDYENDMHPTALGDMAGPLIITNLYLSLKHEDGRITFGILFYLFSGFLVLSGLLLYPSTWLVSFHQRCEETPIGLILGELFLYGFFIWLMAFLCFYCTNFHINVSLQALYVVLFSAVRNYWDTQKRKLQNQKVVLYV